MINASGLGDPTACSSARPKERQIDPFGQGFGGEVGRLVTGNDSLDYISGARNASRISRLT